MALSKLKKFNDGLRPYIRKVEDSREVSKHLFRLASGLESMIIGEFQIVEQIKSAYKRCKKNNMLSPTLERMIHKSLETSKFIRNNTEIDKGGISVSSAAIDQIGKLKNSEKLSILCVGAGRTSKLSIKQLYSKKFKNMSSIYKKGRDGYYYYQTYVYNPESKKKDKRLFHALGTRDPIEAATKQRKLDLQYEKQKNIDEKHP